MLLNTCSFPDVAEKRRRKPTAVSDPVPDPAVPLPGPDRGQAPVPGQNNAAANNAEECPHCLLSLCITEGGSDAEFVGGGQGPCAENRGIRHRQYRRYWTQLDFLGVWQKPRYLARKVESAGGEWVLVVKRELMPVCVLKKVRTLYPNPSGVPYVEHMWE